VSIEAKVFTALGPTNSSRVYPDVLPQNPTYPAVAYQVIAAAPAPITRDAAYVDYQVQVGIHAQDFSALLTLRASVIAALKAMPEFIDYTEISGGFEFDPKAYVRILTVRFRDTET
jgi:hypothetical protein